MGTISKLCSAPESTQVSLVPVVKPHDCCAIHVESEGFTLCVLCGISTVATGGVYV